MQNNQINQTDQIYNYSLKVGNKTIKYRKWKVKDRKKYITSVKNNDEIKTKEAIIYDCIEDKNIVLSDEECKYVLINIRTKSFNTNVNYVFNCEKCKTDYEYNANILDLVKPTFKPLRAISVNVDNKNYNVAVGELRNRQFYEEMISSHKDEKDIIDFILHIQAFNDNVSFTFDEIVQIVNDMDIDAFDAIYREWENMRFKLDCTHQVQCPNCAEKDIYIFDTFPGFFPNNWQVNDNG